MGRIVWLMTVAGMLGCAAPTTVSTRDRVFDFQGDTFAYTNNNYWQYDLGPNVQSRVLKQPKGNVDYHQRCTVMSRTARQFFYNARFDPDSVSIEVSELRERVRDVLARNSRAEQVSSDPVSIPGFRDLRALSSEHEKLLKEELSGRWLGYFQRGNWRMIFPFSPRSQRETARELVADLVRGHLPIVHIVNFPRIDINHTVLVIGFEETPLSIRFSVYDPNYADRPRSFSFARASATFSYNRTDYFPGGAAKVYEVYDGVFF